MNFNLYKPTELEQWLNQKYRDNGIYYPDDMDLDRISEIFDAEVHFWDGEPFSQWKDGEFRYIILNAYMRTEERREKFFHELCHPLKHAGRQDDMPHLLKELQEMQATLFALYAAMPIYMVAEIAQDVYSWSGFKKHLAEAFHLPPSFVQKRIDQIQNRIYWEQQEQEHRERMAQPRKKITDEHVRNVIEQYIRRKQEREEREGKFANG